MKEYTAVEGTLSHEIVIERSRFIATVRGIDDADGALALIAEMKKQYSNATHNCYAYISNAEGTEARFSDAGEPQGTAGLPMLEVLKKKGLSKTAVVVTRYFGGVKLGAGGLVSAYTQVVAEALDKAVIKKYSFSDIIELTFLYGFYQAINQHVLQSGAAVIDSDFAHGVKLTVAVPEENTDAFTARIRDITKGQMRYKMLEKRYHKYTNNVSR